MGELSRIFGGGLAALVDMSVAGGSGRSRCRVYGFPVDAVIFN
jgi:hypothetical protein